jgi:hypothetical protein
MLMLPEVDRALLRKDEWRKCLEWRLGGIAVYNLCKASCTHTKSFTNIYYINLSLSISLRVQHCLAFKTYTGTSIFPFRSLRTSKKTQHFTITKIKWLIFLNIAVYSENHTVHRSRVDPCQEYESCGSERFRERK